MGAALLPDAAFGLAPRCPFVPRHPFICRITSTRSIRNRKYSFIDKRISKSVHTIFSHTNDSDDMFTDVVFDQDDYSGRNEIMRIEDELVAVKKSLSEAQDRQEEYITAILHDKEVAIAELEAAKSLFQKKLEESVEEKFTLESKLVLAKQDAVDLAVQVEKLAEVAFQQATSHILEDAQLRISSAETTAAEAAHLIEKQIKDATDGTISSIVEKSKYAIEKALVVAEEAGEHAKEAMETFINGTSPFTEIASVQAENIKLQGMITDIESQLMIARNEVDRLKSQQKYHSQTGGGDEVIVGENEERCGRRRMKAISKAFKTDLKNIKATTEAVKEVVHCKDNAYLRRCEAQQRSLKASEDALKMWRQRAEMAESLLLKERLQDEGDEDSLYVVNGGRIDLLTNDDSQKWKLLSDGPRREIPQWIARRIKAVSPKFPPRKPKEGDALIEHVFERETIEKKRKALERALQRKTIQWQRAPEQTKLEPGTGTGREIVFQAFNWESWRRRWYLELASKTADLSQCGMTAVWLPPPTDSVSPQGYMPSDLYNLNSSYGSVEELKYCIEELHSQDLLALGDVVLNHRCASETESKWCLEHFWWKLAWGPEAIVCDDPNFQGREILLVVISSHAAPNIDHFSGLWDTHSALHNEYWRLIDPQGKPTGVLGWWPSRAVTFLENHDTGSTQGHWPFPRDKLMQGYAYILTHPGTPVIFYDHFYDFGIHDVITELIEARRRAGIHCRSSIKIYHANNEGYVAQVGDALVMKLGQFDWNPSKENHLEGSWQKFVDKGSDYQVG
ncbi:Glycosyl hydrolase, family 13, catalytic domain [Sesbania bispinosa]|nr:Glycosyl hydrolase, family 13, catalytic domain [Sesbania bispinosa]